MRILVTITHYFSAEANPRHASTGESRVIAKVICANRDQIYWMRQLQWADRAYGFTLPLERASTLRMAKSFSIQKTYCRSAGFLAIEQMDSGFSSLKMSVVPPL